jgi:hypothetical protein
VAGGGWASSGADEEGRGATMELKSAIMPPLGPTVKAVAMALWPRHQCVGPASDALLRGSAAADGLVPASMPAGALLLRPVVADGLCLGPTRRAGKRWRSSSMATAHGLRPGPAQCVGRATVRHCGGGSEASIGRRVRAGLTVQGCARVFFCISIKALLGSYGRDDV